MTSNPDKPNIDPAEIAKFEVSAHRWWDPNSEYKPLHDINPLRLGFIERHLNLAGKRVLDVGCGGGILSEAMVRRGAEVTGIDMGEAPLNVARLHSLESGLQVDYHLSSAEDYAEQHPGEFDLVTCMEMLEHVPHPASVLKACSTLLKPGGLLAVSTINRNPKAYLFAVLGAEYLLNLLPRGTHDYQRFIRPSELAAWARNLDLELIDLAGMSYNPLFKRYRLGKDVDVNYLACLRKPQEATDAS